ncbi:hypothetical protein ACQPUZ_04905 [Clostridium tertium]
MNGREIIELIKKHNLEEVEIGLSEINDLGYILDKPICGIIKVDEYYHACYFADEKECRELKKYKLK